MRIVLYFVIIIQSVINVQYAVRYGRFYFLSLHMLSYALYDARALVVNLFLGILRSQNDLFENKTSLAFSHSVTQQTHLFYKLFDKKNHSII